MFFLFVAKCLCLTTPSCPVHFFSARLFGISERLGTDHLKAWENTFKVRENSESFWMYMLRAQKSAVQLFRTSRFSCQASNFSFLLAQANHLPAK